MQIKFSNKSLSKVGTVVVGLFQGKSLSQEAQDINKLTQGILQRAINNSRFEGKEKQMLTLTTAEGCPFPRVVAIGLGDIKALNETKLVELGGQLLAYLKSNIEETIEIRLDDIAAKAGLSVSSVATQVALGMRLRAWWFDKYLTKQKAEDKISLKTIHFKTSQAQQAETAFKVMEKVVEGVHLTRELVSEPANVLTPAALAQHAQALTKIGVKVEVLNEKKLKELKMGALLGVAQGSENKPCVVVMSWQGGAKNQPPLAFIGKGVTFDTGGISIKPAANMWDMKYDMAGAGVVIGLMKALAGRKAKVNAVGVVGLVENMPSGTAQRPGDIVKSMSGQTIEVLNTDAEGRLLLADVLWYTQDRFKPQFMVNLATLTGAIVVALGSEYAGIFSNNDDLTKKIAACGEKINEKVWRLPLHEAYDKDIDSPAADVKNLGSSGSASSITAAQFLQRFVNNVPWAHLDIAGVAWSKKDLPIAEKGATAFGVRLLDRLVQDYYEK